MDNGETTFRQKLERLNADGYFRLYTSVLLKYGRASPEDIKFINKMWSIIYGKGTGVNNVYRKT